MSLPRTALGGLSPFLLLVLPAVSPLARGEAGEGSRVFDRAVASVQGRVITLSEVTLEARVRLVQAGALEAAYAELTDEPLAAALEQSIGESLEVAEADKLGAFPLEEAEVEAKLLEFVDRLGSRAELDRFMATHDVELPEIVAILARGLRAAKVLDSKLRLRAQVSEAEVRAFYDRNAGSMTMPYGQARAAVRQKLVRERLAELTKAELEKLRRGADVRLIAPFARRARLFPKEEQTP